MNPVNTFRFWCLKNINRGRNKQRLTLILTFEAEDRARNKCQTFIEVRIVMKDCRAKHINID